MTMEGFHSTFFSFGNSGNVAADWEHHFTSYDPRSWDEEGDGVLQFFESPHRYSLTVVHNAKFGFLLNYSVRNLDEKSTPESAYSIGKKSQLANFKEVVEGSFYPTGCFVTPSTAWKAVEDFLANPTKRSSRIDWIDESILSWPEM